MQVDGCLGSLFGHHMDVRPVAVVLSAFENGQVEGAVFFSYRSEVMIVAGVASEVESVFFQLQYIGIPERATSFETTAREMAGGGCREGNVRQGLYGLPPICLRNIIGVVAEGCHCRTNSNGEDDLFYFLFETGDGMYIEVIVVVMCQDEDVDGRHVFRAIDIGVGEGFYESGEGGCMTAEDRVYEDIEFFIANEV